MAAFDVTAPGAQARAKRALKPTSIIQFKMTELRIAVWHLTDLELTNGENVALRVLSTGSRWAYLELPGDEGDDDVEADERREAEKLPRLCLQDVMTAAPSRRTLTSSARLHLPIEVVGVTVKVMVAAARRNRARVIHRTTGPHVPDHTKISLFFVLWESNRPSELCHAS